MCDFDFAPSILMVYEYLRLLAWSRADRADVIRAIYDVYLRKKPKMERAFWNVT